MKIAIFNFSNDHWQQSALLDHTINLLREGKMVTWVDGCDSEIWNQKYKISINANNLYAKYFGINRIFKLLKKEYPNFRYLKLDKLSTRNIFQFKVNEKVIFEQLVTELRDSKPCLSHNQKLIFSIKNTYNANLNRCSNFFRQNEFDYIIIFNGRFIKERSCWEAARNLKIKVKFIERFSPQWTDRYMLFELPVHSIEYRSKIMLDFYDSSSDRSKNTIAKKWFNERIDGISQTFTANQTENFLNESKLKIVSFFHSSEDELFATDLGSNFWSDQMDFLKDLIQIVNQSSRYYLVIRLHPNLMNKSKKEINRWKVFSIENSSENIKFLLPEDPINSYSLIKNSEKVITFGSTIGVEAAYLNRLSILAGTAFHQTMGITLNVSNHNELVKAIKMEDFSNEVCDSQIKSLTYGYFLSSGGTKFQNLVSNEKKLTQDGDFNYKGISFKKPRVVSLVFRIEKKFHEFNSNKCDQSCTI